MNVMVTSKRLALVVTTTLGIALGSTKAEARVIHVPDSAATIQAGMSAAQSGDTVLVAPGTYTENIHYLGRAIKLISSHGAPGTIIRPSVAAAATVNLNGTTGGTALLSGFTIAGGSDFHVVDINGSQAVQIVGNIFRDRSDTNQNGVSIDCHAAVPPLIAGNVFYNNVSAVCIGVYSGGATILNNTFDANANGFFSHMLGTIARNNIVTNSEGYGISGSYAELDYNCVWQNGANYAGGAVGGPNSISADPMYGNSPIGNFTIDSTSPCCGTGQDGVNMGAETGPCMICDCHCLGDPQCDGIVNVLDVVRAVDVAFRNVGATQDADCPVARTDVNCSGVTEVFDVVGVIGVAFRNESQWETYCRPCE